ncbi:MAG: glycosyltransferase family 8 protein [Lachnospiraceae bacterium]|nr:glycosyltransferase family 8 protein [Lachnospiraceae bacterium]
MDKTINISTALNERYVPYTYTMLFSLFTSNPGTRVRVFLLFGELSEGSLADFRELGERFNNDIVFCNIDKSSLPEDLPVGEKWQLEIYFRLFLTDILPPDIDRLLYLDGDIIVNKPLDDLYDTDFEGAHLVVCKDMGISEDNIEWHKNARAEGLRHIIDTQTYFNSGVMLMNIELLREFCPPQTYLDVAKEFDYQIFAPDQDLLNYVHYGHVKYADPHKYDLLTDIARDRGESYDSVIDETVIYHYTGDKPWAGDRIHYDIEKVWWDYALETPYREWLRDKFISECICGGGVKDLVQGLRSDLRTAIDSFNKLRSLIGNM